MSRSTAALAITAAALVLAAAAIADPTDPKVKETKADQAHATASVLQAFDLGAAWTGSAEKPVSIKIPVCAAGKTNNSDLTMTGHAEAVVSLASSGLQVDSDVEIFKTAGQVDTLFKRILQPRLAGCLRYDLLKSVAGTAVTVGAVTRLTVAKVGTHSALFRVGLTYKTGGKQVPVDNDFLFIAKRRTMFFTSIVAPGSLESQLPAFENRLATMLAENAKV